MKRRDFFNLSVSAVPGLALLSCSKKANPIEPVLEASELPSAAFVPQAQALATIGGQLPNDGKDHVGRLITITDDTIVFATHCGSVWKDYVCTVSDQDGGASLTSTCSLLDTLLVAVGDQFDIVRQTPCNGQLDLTLIVHTEPPEALINLLIGEVQDLIDANVLDHAGNGLLAILNTVLSGVQNDRPSAIPQLNAFIHAVEGLISDGQRALVGPMPKHGQLLTPGEGEPLIGVAQVAIDQLNG